RARRDQLRGARKKRPGVQGRRGLRAEDAKRDRKRSGSVTLHSVSAKVVSVARASRPRPHCFNNPLILFPLPHEATSWKVDRTTGALLAPLRLRPERTAAAAVARTSQAAH